MCVCSYVSFCVPYEYRCLWRLGKGTESSGIEITDGGWVMVAYTFNPNTQETGKCVSVSSKATRAT